MRRLYVLLLTFGVLIYFEADANSVPAPRLTRLPFEDTTFKLTPTSATATVAKKQGFFGRLKNKLLAFVFGNQKANEGGSNTKQTLGWVSIGLFVLGFASLALGGVGGGVALLLFPAGIAVGIVALAKKGDKNNPKDRKTGRLLGIIGIVLGVCLIVGLAIALSSWK